VQKENGLPFLPFDDRKEANFQQNSSFAYRLSWILTFGHVIGDVQVGEINQPARSIA